MTQDQLKQQAAQAAMKYVEDDSVVGVGTGSTTNYFIDELAKIKGRIQGAVSSSEASSARLAAAGVRILELNSTGDLDLYVDGADELTVQRALIKGGGGALTREKIVAAASRCFVCIADASKRVEVLGRFPLPVEVIPMAQSYVARQLVKLGGRPVLRAGLRTDNGNVILDVHGLTILDPVRLEAELNQITGVVCNGLFARRPADVVLLAGEGGIEVLGKAPSGSR